MLSVKSPIDESERPWGLDLYNYWQTAMPLVRGTRAWRYTCFRPAGAILTASYHEDEKKVSALLVNYGDFTIHKTGWVCICIGHLLKEIKHDAWRQLPSSCPNTFCLYLRTSYLIASFCFLFIACEPSRMQCHEQKGDAAAFLTWETEHYLFSFGFGDT